MLRQTSVDRVASLADRLAERTLTRLHEGELSREEVRSSSEMALILEAARLLEHAGADFPACMRLLAEEAAEQKFATECADDPIVTQRPFDERHERRTRILAEARDLARSGAFDGHAQIADALRHDPDFDLAQEWLADPLLQAQLDQLCEEAKSRKRIAEDRELPE
jgi:hypothetical protein